MKHIDIIRNEHDKAKIISRLQSMEVTKPVQITSEFYRKDRSLAQNRLFWAMMNELAKKYEASHGTFHSPDTWAAYYKKKFLGEGVEEVRGVVTWVPISTTKLKVGEFSDFIERIYHDAATDDEIQIILSKTEDYHEAMGVKDAS